MLVLVETIKLPQHSDDSEKLVQRKVINYNDTSDSIWLRNHSAWAFRNGYRINAVIAPPDDRVINYSPAALRLHCKSN